MNTLLAVFSCSTCSSALLRHWEYFERQKADQSLVIGTEDRKCQCPNGIEEMKIGLDSYIMGPHLPRRLVNTLETLFKNFKWNVLILAEYDTLILKRIPIEKLNEVAAHKAGKFRKDFAFYHNPWVFSRTIVPDFIDEGRKVIEEGICQEGAAEASPDVFFGHVCYRMKQPIQEKLWSQFSRNSFDCEGDLERARLAYRSNVDVIHGCKTEQELNYITAP